MPIYQYRCTECGQGHEALQKMSDAPLLDCPACGKSALKKQLTAAAFQLKGTGWYATDFKNSGKPAQPAATKSADSDSGAAKAATESSSSGSTSASPSAVASAD